MDYTKQYRSYRPKNGEDMKKRIQVIQRKDRYRISKSKRYTRVSQRQHDLTPRSCHQVRESCSKFERVFRDYSDSQSAILSSDLRDAHPVNSWRLMLDGSCLAPDILPQNHDPKNFVLATTSLPRTPNFSKKILRDQSYEKFKYTPSPAVKDGVCLSDIERAYLRELPRPPTSIQVAVNSHLINDEDRNPGNRPVSSLSTLAHQLTTRSPAYVQHIYSVLRCSLTDSDISRLSRRSTLSTFSWESSWMTFSTKKTHSETSSSIKMSQNLTAEQELATELAAAVSGTFLTKIRRSFKRTKREREVWNDIVDECQLIPAPDRRPSNVEISLVNRECCLLADNIDASCEYCGFSVIHAWARRGGDGVSYSYFGTIETINKSDYFGNTPLHYAAASGNASSDFLLRMIKESHANIFAKNSSNQTFLHVLKAPENFFWSKSSDPGGYMLLHRILQIQDFPFYTRDCDGRTVAHVLFHLLPSNLRDLEFVERWSNSLDNHGYTPRDRISRTSGDMELLSTKPINSLNSSRHSVPSILNEINLNQSVLVPMEAKLDIPFNIDFYGDTPLIALVKKWKESDGSEEILGEKIKLLVDMQAVVDARDRKGRTSLAIAAIRGLRLCAQVLLSAKANPNIKDYNGRGIIFHALRQMGAASEMSKDAYYAKILSCIILLLDHGAKLEPTERDEWLLQSAKEINISIGNNIDSSTLECT